MLVFSICFCTLANLPCWWCQQDEARVAYWCLSRQTLQPHVLKQHRADLVTAIALGLVTSNKWNSMQCVFHSLRCIARLAHQVPETLRECAPLWLPQLWRLLLVQPVTDYEKVHPHPMTLELHPGCLATDQCHVAPGNLLNIICCRRMRPMTTCFLCCTLASQPGQQPSSPSNISSVSSLLQANKHCKSPQLIDLTGFLKPSPPKTTSEQP